MTVITYSSAAERLPKEIQVLEHPSTSRNVPEPPAEILKPWTILEPMENQIQDSCGVKGHRWIEQRGILRGAEEEGVKRKRQTCGSRVSGERINEERRDEQFNLKNKCNKDVRKDLKCVRECVEEGHKSRKYVSGLLSADETEGEIKQIEEMKEKRRRRPVFPWPFHLENITEGKEERKKRGKNMVKRKRWHHIFLWLILLLFSLCPKPASSQVRVALKREF